MPVEAETTPSRARAALPWLREIAVIGVVYVVYGFVRNQFGSANVDYPHEPLHAFNNAVRIIGLEKHLGLFHEQSIQRFFLGTPWIKLFNIFYGTAHFIVTLGVLIWLFLRHRSRFGKWRTMLMVTTVLALVGFALFPLMPPRLFNATPSAKHPYGGETLATQHHQPEYHFVDTLRDVGGLWSFDSEKLDKVSNQYAAMPSLHIGWSTWCMIVLLRFGKRKRTKYLAVLYPLLTLTAIVATANHYILDAAGGLVIVGAGYLVARLAERLTTRSPAPGDLESATVEPAQAAEPVVADDPRVTT